MFLSAFGGAALLLGVAYGVTTRQYRDAEIDTLEKTVARLEASRAAEDGRVDEEINAALAELSTREAEFSDRIAKLEAALGAAEDRAEAAEASAAAAVTQVAAAPVEDTEAPAETTEAVGDFGDAENGAEIFAQCSACHSVGQGAKDRVGPHLNGIFGRRAGSHEGFRYSEDMAMLGNDGLTWTLETLNAYMENPKALVSRTRMNFDGLQDPGDRADVLAYLRTFSDDPSNIPEAAPTAVAAARDVGPEILAIQGDPEYGEYLSSECTTCHQASGADDGIPSITLWPEEDFVVAMHAYKDKLRPHPVMQMLAGRLNNEEIAALAAYFAQLEE
uniref:Sulfur/thiosulfate oxidation protein SoxE n=1 Tax=uncultured bacterium ws101A12 TaxID=1131826 RepID=I1X4F6_9BACT|nr:sulfur/thiosulfate oxidation protein SoxE [uncultured bacterium ws101A12]